MRIPTDTEIDRLMHFADYDPAKARAYYLRTRKLKGRKPGAGDSPGGSRRSGSQDPRTGKSRGQISRDARATQRKELAAQISHMEDRLKQLEAKIATRIREEKSEDRKGKAKKERAAKEKDKPKTAAEKAEAARESKKYRDKNQQKVKSDAKKDASSSGGGDTKKDSAGKKKKSVTELKSLATKVKGQLAVAKQKLAAL